VVHLLALRAGIGKVVVGCVEQVGDRWCVPSANSAGC
jgi:hypothetical protein